MGFNCRDSTLGQRWVISHLVPLQEINRVGLICSSLLNQDLASLKHVLAMIYITKGKLRVSSDSVMRCRILLTSLGSCE